MQLKIADRMASMQPSAIREILKATADPNVISFAGGNPAADTFPVQELGAIAADMFAGEGITALQYGVTEGYTPLLKETEALLRGQYDIGGEGDGVLITSGGQQAIDLVCKCLLNEGDIVLCEGYSFIGAINTFRSYNCNVVGVPMDEEGMNLQALEEALSNNPRAKLIYTIPTFQNPMGVTMTRARRQQVYDIAVKYGVMIVEDAPYFQLRYSGEEVPAIKTLDREGQVIYMGSFSKIISPGLRVGFVCARGDLLKKMTVAKQIADVHSPIITQMLVAEFLKRHDLAAHIDQCRALYREKRDRMLKRMEEKFPKEVSFTRPEGGLFLWCTMPAHISGMEFCSLASKKGVACVPGGTFHPAGDPKSPCFRVNFSLPTLEQIDKGVDILADCLREMLG